MLRLMRCKTRLSGVVFTAMLVGLLMVPLGACSMRDGSDSGAQPARGAVEYPEETQPAAEGRIGAFLERGLSELLSGPSAPRVGGAIGRDDGYIPDGASVSPFETDHPAIANLDVALLAAVQRAAEDARNDGVEVRVTSGWRSPQYQQDLLEQAVSRYGGVEEARRFVNAPDQSTHVTGRAVDIGPTDASYWMSRYGAAYGLCQTYANEIWHYELSVEPGGTCAAPLPDASAG